MLNQSLTEELPGTNIAPAQVERFRERLKLIEARVQKQSQEEKLNQVRALLREEATQILLPALQDAMAQMTLQVLPDPRLAQSIERTSQEMVRMADSMGTLSEAQRLADKNAREATERMAATMEAMFAATTEEVTGAQTRAAEALMREQQTLARRQRFWTFTSAGMGLMVVVTLGLGTLTWWRWDQKARLGAELSRLAQDHSALQNQTQVLAKEVVEQQSLKDSLEEAVEHLRAEEVAVRLKIRESAETVTAIDQAREKTQADIRRLQEIQERNRFKLVPGTEGAIFVEVQAGAKPFVYEGKNYVRVRD